jgi:pimeloyl-ACP methyl ester carboxylesterase
MTLHVLAKQFAAPIPLLRKPVPAWSDALLSTSYADLAVRESSGKKLPILLLHAEASSKRVFNPLLEGRLGHEYRMIAIDLPGHGGSSNAHDPATYSAEGYADTALEALELLGVDEAVVFDASADGRIGRELMSIFPGLLGLAIQGALGGDLDGQIAELDSRVFEMPVFHEGMLDLMMKSMELKQAALRGAPTLWYGG